MNLSQFTMPVISVFFGMVIRIYHVDHPPPHIHVSYGECEVIVEISSCKVLKGQIPKRLLKILFEWIILNRAEVELSWQDAQKLKPPRRVKPLK